MRACKRCRGTNGRSSRMPGSHTHAANCPRLTGAGTRTPLPQLVLALDSDFAGVGEAEHTIITVSEQGEYTTMDRRYHMNSHTFTLATAEPIARFTAQHLHRMQYLRRKLLDDLATGDKIFVYKSERGVSDDEGRELFAAIRRHGGHAALLCVRLETEEHPRGTLTRLEDGLFIATSTAFRPSTFTSMRGPTCAGKP